MCTKHSFGRVLWQVEFLLPLCAFVYAADELNHVYAIRAHWPYFSALIAAVSCCVGGTVGWWLRNAIQATFPRYLRFVEQWAQVVSMVCLVYVGYKSRGDYSVFLTIAIWASCLLLRLERLHFSPLALIRILCTVGFAVMVTRWSDVRSVCILGGCVSLAGVFHRARAQ